MCTPAYGKLNKLLYLNTFVHRSMEKRSNITTFTAPQGAAVSVTVDMTVKLHFLVVG